MDQQERIRPYLDRFLDPAWRWGEEVQEVLASVPAGLWPAFEAAASRELEERVDRFEREHQAALAPGRPFTPRSSPRETARAYNTLLAKQVYLVIEQRRRAVRR